MSRKKAVVTEGCTGCGGAPVCRIFCPRDALVLFEDRENEPFRRMQVDESACTGCGSCVSRGPQGVHLLGCPWNAIRLVAA